MVRPGIDFMRTLLRFPAHWKAWLGALIAANLLAPLAFLPAIEAWATLAAFMLGALSQMVIFSRVGFARLLGAGHWPWLLLVPWIWLRTGGVSAGSPMGAWMWGLVVLNTTSVLIDAVDVTRYLLGERAPTLTLESV